MFNSYHYSLNSMLSFTVRQHFTTLFNSCIQLPVHKDGFLQLDLIDFLQLAAKIAYRPYASPTEILTLPKTFPSAFFYMEQNCYRSALGN